MHRLQPIAVLEHVTQSSQINVAWTAEVIPWLILHGPDSSLVSMDSGFSLKGSQLIVQLRKVLNIKQVTSGK
jgi:hypothetical protein